MIRVVGAAIVREGRCLVAQRGPGRSLSGKWEFPGGKVEPGEEPEHALSREIAEELGVAIVVRELVGTGQARVGEHDIILDVFAASLSLGEPVPREHAQLLWASADELQRLDWAEADVPAVGPMIELLRGQP